MSWYDLYYRVYGRGDMTDEQVDLAVQIGRITQEQAERIKNQDDPNMPPSDG